MIDEHAKIAVHDTEIKHLQKDMDKLVEDMEEIKKTIGEINKILAEAKGGWHMLMVLGGLGAAVGATFGWFIEQFVGKH